VRNKANSAPAQQWARAGTAADAADGADCTNKMPATKVQKVEPGPRFGADIGDYSGRFRLLSGASNKANFSAWTGTGEDGQRSSAKPSLGPVVQTKPISRHRPRWVRARSGASEATLRPTAPNKANFSTLTGTDASREGRQRYCHRGTSVPNKPNSAGATGRAITLWKKSYDELDLPRVWAKQSQFAGSGG
jgi:hypothetical protein